MAKAVLTFISPKPISLGEKASIAQVTVVM